MVNAILLEYHVCTILYKGRKIGVTDLKHTHTHNSGMTTTLAVDANALTGEVVCFQESIKNIPQCDNFYKAGDATHDSISISETVL
jgi:hypothetical protein